MELNRNTLYWASNHKWYLEVDRIAYGPFVNDRVGFRFHERFGRELVVDKSKRRAAPKFSPNGSPIRKPFRGWQFTGE